MIENETPVEDTDTVAYWQERARRFEEERNFFQTQLQTLMPQLEDVKLNLEVANKRWLNAINEGVQYEVALLKLQRNNTHG